jgi:hypothetical protein
MCDCQRHTSALHNGDTQCLSLSLSFLRESWVVSPGPKNPPYNPSRGKFPWSLPSSSSEPPPDSHAHPSRFNGDPKVQPQNLFEIYYALGEFEEILETELASQLNWYPAQQNLFIRSFSEDYTTCTN